MFEGWVEVAKEWGPQYGIIIFVVTAFITALLRVVRMGMTYMKESSQQYGQVLTDVSTGHDESMDKMTQTMNRTVELQTKQNQYLDSQLSLVQNRMTKMGSKVDLLDRTVQEIHENVKDIRDGRGCKNG